MTTQFAPRPETPKIPPLYDGVRVHENSEEIVEFLVARSVLNIALEYYGPNRTLSMVVFDDGRGPFGRSQAPDGFWILYNRDLSSFTVVPQNFVEKTLMEV